MRHEKSFLEIILDKLYIHIKKKGPFSYTIHKESNSKQITVLKVKPKIIQSLEENTVESLCDIGIDNGLLVITQTAQTQKEINDIC